MTFLKGSCWRMFSNNSPPTYSKYQTHWSNWSILCVHVPLRFPSSLGNTDLLGTFYLLSGKSAPPCTSVQPFTQHSCLGPNRGLPEQQRSAVYMISQSEGWLFKSKTYPVLVDEYPGVVCCTSQIYQKYWYSHIQKCAFVFRFSTNYISPNCAGWSSWFVVYKIDHAYSKIEICRIDNFCSKTILFGIWPS